MFRTVVDCGKQSHLQDYQCQCILPMQMGGTIFTGPHGPKICSEGEAARAGMPTCDIRFPIPEIVDNLFFMIHALCVWGGSGSIRYLVDHLFFSNSASLFFFLSTFSLA